MARDRAATGANKTPDYRQQDGPPPFIERGFWRPRQPHSVNQSRSRGRRREKSGARAKRAATRAALVNNCRFPLAHSRSRDRQTSTRTSRGATFPFQIPQRKPHTYFRQFPAEFSCHLSPRSQRPESCHQQAHPAKSDTPYRVGPLALRAQFRPSPITSLGCYAFGEVAPLRRVKTAPQQSSRPGFLQSNAHETSEKCQHSSPSPIRKNPMNLSALDIPMTGPRISLPCWLPNP
jgi:hypothetical protein